MEHIQYQKKYTINLLNNKMHLLPIKSPIFQPQSLASSSPLNSMHHTHQPIAIQKVSGEHAISNKLRGTKLHMSQIRQKQQLKTQLTNHMHAFKNYVNSTIEGEFFNKQSRQNKEDYITNITIGEPLKNSIRPRTGGIFTADNNLFNKRKIMSESIQSYKNRNIIVTSQSVKNRVQSLNTRAPFVSPNLNEKKNNYMNMVIRNQISNPSQLQNFISHIHTQGIIPHSRKLNNFQRKLKKRINSKIESKDKIKINLDTDLIDLKTISKTLQTINSHNQSPIVNNLQQKTIFGKLSNSKNNMKKPYFQKINEKF